VKIGESYTVAVEIIDMGGLDVPVAMTGQISIATVISQDEHDVGFLTTHRMRSLQTANPTTAWRYRGPGLTTTGGHTKLSKPSYHLVNSRRSALAALGRLLEEERRNAGDPSVHFASAFHLETAIASGNTVLVDLARVLLLSFHRDHLTILDQIKSEVLRSRKGAAVLAELGIR
jgi:hypothetical protein